MGIMRFPEEQIPDLQIYIENLRLAVVGLLNYSAVVEYGYGKN